MLRWPSLAAVHAADEAFAFEQSGNRSVRQGDWKIVWDRSWPEAQPRWELFDIATDPAEQHDLSPAQQERLAQLNRGLPALRRAQRAHSTMRGAALAAGVAELSRSPRASEHRCRPSRVEHGGSRVRPTRRSTRSALRPWCSWRPGRSRWAVTRRSPRRHPHRRKAFGTLDFTGSDVTNAKFAEFVAATGYATLAERGVRTAAALDAPVVGRIVGIYAPNADKLSASPRNAEYWWRFVPGASWRAPEGPGSSARWPRTTPGGAHRLRGCARRCTVAWA